MKNILFIVLMSSSMLWAEKTVDPMRVGLMLPLQADVTKRDKNMDRFVDFYTGALLAVYETQQTGQKIEIYTYDAGKSAYQMEQVLATNELPQLDMIIGPAYPSQVPVMAAWAAQHQVRVLLPFASDIPQIETNPYLLQFNPSERSDAEALVESVVMKGEPVRFVFVEAEEKAIPSSVREIQQCVKAEGVEYVYTSIQQIMRDSLAEALSDMEENLLVMNTERYANLRQVMPYLNRAAQGHRLTLVTRYVWQDDPIVLDQLYPTVFREKMDVDSTAYGTLYRRFVNSERVCMRPKYDVLGYDLMHYALQTIAGLREAETAWEQQEVMEREYLGLQSDIRFERVGEGGYRNKKIYIVRSK